MPSASRISSDRWRQIADIFHAASECREADRSAFLDEACGTDAELRREVESLLQSSSLAASDGDASLTAAIGGTALDYLHSGPIAEGTCLDHYQVIRLLGAGGMGEVYLAEDIRLKRKVALKMLPSHLANDAAALEQLEYEARVVSALNHANLLTVYEFCHEEGRHFFVTEFIEGQTVRQMLRGGPLAPAIALDIATQAARGLSAAHASGVTHRDIKPENIMVRADGSVKLLDFGIAKLAEAQHEARFEQDVLNTEGGAVLGTPRYMSPEQARGVKLDARTDLFSLGAVLYEMLMGKPAFHGETSSDLVADILRGEPAPLPRHIPKRVQAVVRSLLAKDRSQRCGSAALLLAELEAIRRHAEWPGSSGHALRWAGALLLCALVLGGMWVMTLGHTPRQSSAPRSLAVLPFHNLKPDASTDFLGFSLADQVIAKLAYVKALTVRPSSSVTQYRDANADLSNIARHLNADMLVTGDYVKDGNDLRVTARLVAFHPDAVLWQDSLTVRYDQLLSLQDRVAHMILDGLSLRLGPDEQARFQVGTPANSLAYEYYLRGVDLYSTANFAGAIQMLQKSVSVDPSYASAWAHLGRAYTTNGSLQFGGRDEYRQAEAAYEKAIELNPTLPEPRVYMANLFTDTGRVEAAVPLLRGALQSSPNNAEAHWELGYAYRYGGMLKESEAECELARRLDPEVKINSSALNTYLYLFEYDKFLNSLPANDSPLLVFYHGLGSYYKKDLLEAQADFDRAFDLAPDLMPAQVGKALSEGLQGRAADGVARLHRTEARMNERGVRDAEAMYKVAQAYALLGDRSGALRLLRRSTEGGFFCYSYMSQDPLLRSLHGAPEFARLIELARQRAEQFAKRFGRH